MMTVEGFIKHFDHKRHACEDMAAQQTDMGMWMRWMGKADAYEDVVRIMIRESGES